MTFVEFLSALNSCKQQAVFWHNQTTSYSEHKTLNGFYDDIEIHIGSNEQIGNICIMLKEKYYGEEFKQKVKEALQREIIVKIL